MEHWTLKSPCEVHVIGTNVPQVGWPANPRVEGGREPVEFRGLLETAGLLGFKKLCGLFRFSCTRGDPVVLCPALRVLLVDRQNRLPLCNVQIKAANNKQQVIMKPWRVGPPY